MQCGGERKTFDLAMGKEEEKKRKMRTIGKDRPFMTEAGRLLGSHNQKPMSKSSEHEDFGLS